MSSLPIRLDQASEGSTASPLSGPPLSPAHSESSHLLTEWEDEWYQVLRTEIVRLAPELTKISHEIFDNPEIGGEEVLACRLLSEFLERHEFHIEPAPANLPTAFLATFETEDYDEHSRVIGFFTEYDALPEIGHACGHNLIAVGSVASAIATKHAMVHFGLRGSIQVFGSPDEENLGGKIEFIDAGLLKYPDVCLMAHPGNQDIALMRTLALQSVSVHYHGKAAHAAVMPWEGMNALDAIVQTYQAIAMYRQEMPPGAMVHGIITDGGRACNVIPNHASASYILRSDTKATLGRLKSRVTDIFEGAVRATGCQLRHSWDPMYMEMNFNRNLAGQYQYYMEKLYQVQFPTALEQESRATASTDMGNVSFVKPSIHTMYRVGVGTTCSLHTEGFRNACKSNVAHERTWKAGVVMAMVGLKVLADDDFFDQVHKEFRTTNRQP
ncbi:hypothetical protein IWQ60_001063 [Tieghemiomyces parasiticus]|uniref:Peptidase M20 domain-containing protein 2 n=1 Tax=Tieghemiomyces parasiticus TaxID=78921 RepID=A0A9W8DWY8_9FUNG|nr:hypothetical protein IWQ60_001063 [Tieghemiomyces parasiticus]